MRPRWEPRLEVEVVAEQVDEAVKAVAVAVVVAVGLVVKMVMVIPGGSHGGVFIAGGDALWGQLVVFFVRELGGR